MRILFYLFAMIDGVWRPDVFIVLWIEEYFPLDDKEKTDFFKGLRSFADSNFVLKLFFEGSESLFETIKSQFPGLHDLPVERREGLLEERILYDLLYSEESATH